MNVEPLAREELYVGFKQRESKDHVCMVFAQKSETKNHKILRSSNPFPKEKKLRDRYEIELSGQFIGTSYFPPIPPKKDDEERNPNKP